MQIVKVDNIRVIVWAFVFGVDLKNIERRDSDGDLFMVSHYQMFLTFGFDTAIDVPVIMEDGYILSHEPFDVDDTHFFNIHGHLHSESHVLKMEADGRYFNVSVDVANFAPVKFDYIKERLGR